MGPQGPVGPPGSSGSGDDFKVRKTVSENVANSSVLQDDDQLAFPIGPNEIWTFDIVLLTTQTTANPDIKIGFGVPSGATVQWGGVGPDLNVSNGSLNDTNVNLSVVSGASTLSYGVSNGAAIPTYIRLTGTVINGATGGTVRLRWCQNVAATAPTTVEANSFLKAGRF